MNRTFKILALDGGGIRGLAVAAFLASIEDQINRPVRDYFHLITGTSTGGIIAAALGCGVEAQHIVNLYKSRGQEMFRRKHRWLPWKKAAMVIDPLYDSEALHACLREILGEETLLGDAECALAIPAFNISTGCNEVFMTRHREEYEHDYQIPIWQVAAATSAAPIYFPPVQVDNRGYYIDGGVWENTPVMVGVAEGYKLGVQTEEMHILSMGTGKKAFGISGARVGSFLPSKRWSLPGWGTDLIEIIMRAQNQRALNYVNFFLGGVKQHERVDFDLPPDGCDLDDITKIDHLVYLGSDNAKKNGRHIRERFFCEIVNRHIKVE